MKKIRTSRAFVIVTGIFATTIAFGQEPFAGKPRYVQPTPFSDVINGPGEGPDNVSITADGLTLFWDGTTPDISIWTAERSSLDAEWENVHRVGPAINSGTRNLEPDVTADGLEMYFRRSSANLDYDLPHPDDLLMVATRASINDTWSEATELTDQINSLPCVNMPSVTGDGLEIYFASAEIVNGACLGGRYADIYASRRASKNDDWGEPQLIEPLATSPGISSDGLRLYFVGGDNESRIAKGLPPRTLSDAPSLFVKTRSSRIAEFSIATELNDPPNSAKTWGPEEFTDGTLFFTSDRSGTPRGYGAWQTAPAELCDINGDGTCDVSDLSRRSLFARNLQEESNRARDIAKYDISGDGLINAEDLTTWLSVAAETNGLSSPYLSGDANLDGKVAFDDFLALADGFGGNSRDWSKGNFNGDKKVDFSDFLILSVNFGNEVAAATAAVPEPSSGLLAAFGILGLIHLSRRR